MPPSPHNPLYPPYLKGETKERVFILGGITERRARTQMSESKCSNVKKTPLCHFGFVLGLTFGFWA
jgi:hypothetical protein